MKLTKREKEVIYLLLGKEVLNNAMEIGDFTPWARELLKLARKVAPDVK